MFKLLSAVLAVSLLLASVNAEEANFGRKSNRVQMLNNAVAKIKTLSGGRVGTDMSVEQELLQMNGFRPVARTSGGQVPAISNVTPPTFRSGVQQAQPSQIEQTQIQQQLQQLQRIQNEQRVQEARLLEEQRMRQEQRIGQQPMQFNQQQQVAQPIMNQQTFAAQPTPLEQQQLRQQQELQQRMIQSQQQQPSAQPIVSQQTFAAQPTPLEQQQLRQQQELQQRMIQQQQQQQVAQPIVSQQTFAVQPTPLEQQQLRQQQEIQQQQVNAQRMMDQQRLSQEQQRIQQQQQRMAQPVQQQQQVAQPIMNQQVFAQPTPLEQQQLRQQQELQQRLIQSQQQQQVAQPIVSQQTFVQPAQQQQQFSRQSAPVSAGQSPESLCMTAAPGEILAHPANPTQFLVCYGFGEFTLLDCPEHLVFNPHLRRCDTNLDRPVGCASNPCMNNARCVDLPDFTFRCECPQGLMGQRCEQPDVCASRPCGAEGTCVALPLGSPLPHMCLCNANRAIGDSCQRAEVNPCTQPGSNLRLFGVSANPSIFAHCEGTRPHFMFCQSPLIFNTERQSCDWPL